MNLTVKEIDQQLDNINYKVNNYYKLTYIDPPTYAKVLELLSKLRDLKEINSEDYYKIVQIYKHSIKNYYKIKELIYQEPRRHAQRFIGKKNIREFIFKRDKYKCLCCGSFKNLYIDHIVPINKKGENKISNLQTLCKSCNSKKGTNTIDFRVNYNNDKNY